MKKHLSVPKNNLKHTCAHKCLLSIYIIHNYIIYRSMSPCPNFRDFTYLRVRVVSVSVSVSVLHRVSMYSHFLLLLNFHDDS